MQTAPLLLALCLACTSDPAPDAARGGHADDEQPGDIHGVPRDGDTSLGDDTAADEPEEPAIRFLSPGATATNPVTFRVEVDGPISTVRYQAEGTWDLGASTDAAADFTVTYTFSTLGEREISAVGLDADDNVLAVATRTVTISAPAAGEIEGFGAWLWTIEGTGLTHAELAGRLAALGVARVFVKVADGSADCATWPELCDSSLPATYQAAGLEAWAWSYNYPGNAAAQAQALTGAVAAGYDGYILDIETEFDGATTTLEALLAAFSDARADAVASGAVDAGWPLAATTWGNPIDHGMRVDIIDRYVDLHMPQTYVEVWGASYMANAAYWTAVGTCEYRALGATRPVRHIVSTEQDVITAAQVDAVLAASGPGSSVWRVPGGGTPQSIWDDWAAVSWDMGSFDEEPDCE